MPGKITPSIRNLVAFCILMEYQGGILDKSPDYIMEKYRRYCQTSIENAYNWGLDGKNSKKLLDWILKWEKNIKVGKIYGESYGEKTKNSHHS